MTAVAISAYAVIALIVAGALARIGGAGEDIEDNEGAVLVGAVSLVVGLFRPIAVTAIVMYWLLLGFVRLATKGRRDD